MRNPIYVALDVPSPEKALQLVESLSSSVAGFKVGKELFVSAGPDLVRRIRAAGASVFLDLKFHDIPNTVAKAVAAATRLDVQMLTLHASGGAEMMRAAEEAAQETARGLNRPAPVVLGVTVLTSMAREDLNQVGVAADVGAQVTRLVSLGVQSGLRGFVCSPLEVAGLRSLAPESTAWVTPGIRGPGDAAGDQKRTLSAAEAIEAGATWLVIGRPICADPNPKAAAERILATLRPTA
ncbi:MAG: orotidine-5'-phosphate decarboxylase [Verrucomicrobia bacterium]|nr:orotidine-5'-phosphate decarboxylase [Verrucomicrobiota bacterium]MBI3868624.1 orotidine-5'-phosphate decarboxylase [Verrucomicrobiota bacterium]